MTRAIIGVIVALLVVLIVNAALGGSGSRSPGDDRFVASVRRDNPQLSVAAASDDELLDAARQVCGPDGLSNGDEVWLDSLDVDVSRFVDRAEALCPSR